MYHPLSSRDQSRLQCGKKDKLGIFLAYALFAVRVWKGFFLVSDMKEIQNLDASVICARRLNSNEIITPKNGENFMFPIEDATIKLSGSD